MLGMPFTGSDETALAVALDKALCKKLAAASRVRTPRFKVVGSGEKARGLRFPVIVKPNAEGSSKGVGEACVVDGVKALDALIPKESKALRRRDAGGRVYPWPRIHGGLLETGKPYASSSRWRSSIPARRRGLPRLQL
jgi:D-alanine-D-alanine ligase-like ATP-grasp enzyme